MSKVTFVDVGKPLGFSKFEPNGGAPMGWYRIDILKAKLLEDKVFKAKFTKRELKQIMEVNE